MKLDVGKSAQMVSEEIDRQLLRLLTGQAEPPPCQPRSLTLQTIETVMAELKLVPPQKPRVRYLRLSDRIPVLNPHLIPLIRVGPGA